MDEVYVHTVTLSNEHCWALIHSSSTAFRNTLGLEHMRKENYPSDATKPEICHYTCTKSE